MNAIARAALPPPDDTPPPVASLPLDQLAGQQAKAAERLSQRLLTGDMKALPIEARGELLQLACVIADWADATRAAAGDLVAHRRARPGDALRDLARGMTPQLLAIVSARLHGENRPC